MFIEVDAGLDGILGMAIGCTHLFFNLSSEAVSIPVLLSIGSLHLTNQMRILGCGVQPEFEGNGCCMLSIIYLDCVMRATHLLPIYGLFYWKISTSQILLIYSMYT